MTETTEMLENAENAVDVENVESTEVSINQKTKSSEKTEKVEKSEKAKKTEPAHSQETYSLVTDFNLVLHTTPAQMICEGNGEPGQIGLRQFATDVNHLWRTFEQHDPYAEWQLLKIHDAIQALKAEMYQQESLLRKQLSYLRGIKVKPFRNPRAFVMAFSTANAIVLMGASLISQIDMLTCQILTLKQMGIVPQGLVHTQTYREKIQKIFALSEAWEESGILREEILDNTPKAKRLQKKYGQLPEEILQQTINLPFLFLEA
jgi:hypothetical protein